MKFKAGDKVKVRSDLIPYQKYSGYIFNREMSNYKGKILTIKCVCEENDTYLLKESDYFWTEEMFEDMFTQLLQKSPN